MTTMTWGNAAAQPEVRARPGQAASSLSWSFKCVFSFILLGYVCQLLLLLPDFGVPRTIIRSASFIGSLAMLALLPRRHGQSHPALLMVLASLFIVATLGLFNPDTDSFKGGIAHLMWYVCIMIPLLWASACEITTREFRIILMTVWAFNSASAAVGVLQVQYPGQFQPNISSVIENQDLGTESMKIQLADGTVTLRPMGLTDSPGGAGISSMVAIVISIGLLLNVKTWWFKGIVYASIACAVFCVYLSQLRVVMVVIVVCLAAFCIAMVFRGEFARVTKIVVSLAVVMGGSTLWAFVKGGEMIQERVLSLFADSAANVYYQNRGFFLESTLNDLIPQYPFGAGLARWGMMSFYFGSDSARGPLWAEINWTGWLYDGGVPLMCTCLAAIAMSLWGAWRVTTTRKNGPIGLWAAVIFAYGMGAFAMSFSGHFFLSNLGMEFWMLNGLLFAAVANEKLAKDKERGPAPAILPAPQSVGATPAQRSLPAGRPEGQS